MRRHLQSAAIVLVLVVLQATFIPLLSINGVIPDLLMLWVVYNGIRRGQIEGVTGGFFVGLLQDLITTPFFGLAALSKSMAGFLAGYFFNENKTALTLGTYQYLLILGLCSMVHDLAYYTIFLLGLESSGDLTVITLSLTASAYTMAIGSLPMFAFSRMRFS
ncbi:MAG: rod shape-determining protein MreD [Proteobacteria bacterium]|nr:rod shape-determining protein MreD [Pseudomonadota bacterium]